MRVQMMMLQIKAGQFLEKTKKTIFNRRGEGFVDTAVKILISVVVGALVLAGLYLLFKNVILPTLSDRIQDMFNYEG
jgi:hypothetical protein